MAEEKASKATPARDWLTVPEVAERLGMATATIYVILASRQLGHRKVGPNKGRYQVTEAHLAAYLLSCEQPAQAEETEEPAKMSMAEIRRKGLRCDGKPFHYQW